jgi:hypothetical protein
MDSSLRIEINGVLITGRVDGIGSFTINQSVDETDRVIKATYSSELTFYDDAYQIIKTNLIDDPAGFSKDLPVKVYDSVCGNAVFEGVIKGDAIDWCEPDCSVSCNLMQDDYVGSCLQNKLIWDDTYGFVSNGQYFPVRYCVVHRPIFLHALVKIIASILQLVIAIIYGIVWILTTIAGILSGGLKDKWNQLNSQYQSINNYLDPCKRFHPSPYLREYIQNVCKVCGISGFDSTILNNPSSPYYNTVLFAAQIEKGREKNDPSKKLIKDNLPTETLHTLMRDYLIPLFNADYRVINNRLIFERKDYFYNTNSVWVDTQQLLNEGRLIKDQVCYSWLDKKKFSYGNFKYSEDAQEYLGNEAITRWSDIVEWNPPAYPAGQVYSAAQKGEQKWESAITPARFHADGLGDIDFLITNGANWTDNETILVMAQQTAMNYKFLIADTSDWNRGRIKTGYDNAFCGTGNGLPAVYERYNYPFWFKEGVQGVYGYQNNLYSLFHYIDNPRWPGYTRWGFDFKFEFTCDDLDNFNFDKVITLIKNGTTVTGVIKEVSFDFINHVATVKGEI